MKIYTKRVLLFVGGVIVTTSLVAGGQYFYHYDPEHRAEWMVKKISKKLELSDFQKENLMILKEELIETNKEMRNGREGILGMLQQPTIDRGKALAMIYERTDAVRERAPQIVEAIGNFYDSLTPEQREELREHVAERMEHHHHYHHGKPASSKESHDD